MICACGEGVRFVDGWKSLSEKCPKCVTGWSRPTLQFEWQLMDLPMRAVQEVSLKHAQEHHYDRWSDDEDGWSDDSYESDYDSDGDEFSRKWRKPEDMQLTDLRMRRGAAAHDRGTGSVRGGAAHGDNVRSEDGS